MLSIKDVSIGLFHPQNNGFSPTLWLASLSKIHDTADNSSILYLLGF